MFPRAAALTVDEGQKGLQDSLARAGSTPQLLARKCELILLASRGFPTTRLLSGLGFPVPR